jgi:hypothetical protein
MIYEPPGRRERTSPLSGRIELLSGIALMAFVLAALMTYLDLPGRPELAVAPTTAATVEVTSVEPGQPAGGGLVPLDHSPAGTPTSRGSSEEPAFIGDPFEDPQSGASLATPTPDTGVSVDPLGLRRPTPTGDSVERPDPGAGRELPVIPDTPTILLPTPRPRTTTAVPTEPGGYPGPGQASIGYPFGDLGSADEP